MINQQLLVFVFLLYHKYEPSSSHLLLNLIYCSENMLNACYLNRSFVASTVSVRTLTKKLMKQPSGTCFFFYQFLACTLA
nr:MAG TPA: hypothetical protein [Caudoviricetes sp.]